MSATILDRTQGERRLLLSPQPAYHQDNSTSRLLGRAQHHANLRSFTNSAAEHYTQFNSYRGRDKEEDVLHTRSSTPFLDYVRLNTNLVGTETEDENIEQFQPFVCEQNEPGGDQHQHQQNQKTAGLTANDVYQTDSQHSQQVDPDYLAGRRMRDILAQKAFYTTSTQKLYGGVDWPSRIVPSPPAAGKQPLADMVSFRNESKRYEPRSEKWQKFGSRPFSWDYVQTRDGHHIPGPVRFCSPSKKIHHIPGYMGHVTGGPGEMDNPRTFFAPQNKLRTLQPRYSDTGRKANIPGYTGCVLYCDYQPACRNDPDHLTSTALRTYRPHDEVLCNSRSPFKRTSAMSRMVTLTRPFNPFNKVY